MQIWMNLILAVQLITAVAMIGLVLVQHGKGADMGASFGSGSSGSLFGATGSANFLSRSTAVCATIFFCSTLALAYFGNAQPQRKGSSSVFDTAASAPMASASAPASAAASSAASAPIAAQIPIAPAAPAAPASAASASASQARP
jgi:preprotein translocase subunit SecG